MTTVVLATICKENNPCFSVRSPAPSSQVPSPSVRQDTGRGNATPNWRQGQQSYMNSPVTQSQQASPQPLMSLTLGRTHPPPAASGLLPTPGAASSSWQPPPSPSTSRSVPSQSPPPTPVVPSPQSLPSTPSSPASFPTAAPSPLNAEVKHDTARL